MSTSWNGPVPLLDLQAQYASIKDEIDAAMARVIATQHFIGGPEVEALEHEIAAYSGAAHGIGVSSGTDALLVALTALGIGAGDEVITTSYSFFATAGCVARVGATPVFVDIDPATFNLRLDQVAARITPRTRVIMPVHLFGRVADTQALVDLAAPHGIAVIEDAAQAIGAEFRGRRAGSVGQIGCFSFFPSKNLGAFGDGGMVVTNDDTLAARLRLLRNHGAQPKYYHKVVGGNFRLDALQAAVLRAKLPHLDDWTAARRANAARYRAMFTAAGSVHDPATATCMAAGCGADCALAAQPGIVLPDDAVDGRHIYNQFVIRSAQREQIVAALKAAKIGCEVYYPVPLHLQECFASCGLGVGDMPASECAARESLAIPIYPELTPAMQKRVVDVIAAALRVGG